MFSKSVPFSNADGIATSSFDELDD